MKICYLADGPSIHTKRWCEYFAGQGHEVHLVTFRKVEINNVKVHFIEAGNIGNVGGNWKIFLKLSNVKRIIRQIAPDILHAHYLTSYGTIGALTRFHPFVVTAHGSDLLISPRRSFIYRWAVKLAMKRADWITVVGEHMRTRAVEMGFPKGSVDTITFGIDTSLFNTIDRKPPENEFIIVTTRSFEPVYNHRLFIDALAETKDKIPQLKVIMIGEGSGLNEIRLLVKEKGLADKVFFPGGSL